MQAVVHLHATHSVAISVLEDLDPEDLLPPLTAYYVMRIGRLPLVPYFAPGDMQLAEAVRGYAGRHHAMLLANHGPVVGGSSLAAAADAIEELEATARLYLLLKGQRVRPLTEAQVADIRRRYPLTLRIRRGRPCQPGRWPRRHTRRQTELCGQSATKSPTPCAYSVHKGGPVALGVGMGWFGTRSLSAVLVGATMMLGQATPSAASGPPAPIWSGVYAGIHGGHASADLGYTFVLGFVD